ncbi:kinase-like protein [Aureobasidium sp. EXF-10728]|nr:kinase-like protein [Aureobasidium sp. EXF-10728]
MSSPASVDSDALGWYDVTKTYCIIGIESSNTGILERPENERFLSQIQPMAGLGDGYNEEDDTQAGLALTFSIDSFVDVTEGHKFGRDPEKCDILLGEESGDDVDGLHFRVQLDYTQQVPELDIYNCSPKGIRIDGRLLSGIEERTRVYQGEAVTITAGIVSLILMFPLLDLSNRKTQSRWAELKTTVWSLLRPSVRHTLVPRDARQRYLDAEEDCIWQEARPFRSETGSMTVALAKGKQKQKTGFPVVLKKLRDRKGDAREERINMGETAAMTRVRHENVVSAFRDQWPQGNVILVEHTPHGNITDFIRNHNARRLKEDAVMDLALQTLKALSYLASQGISHRDLKPTKIIVFRTDPPLFKLTEFGGEDLIDAREYLADRIADDTIDYVAPEIFERGAGALPSKTDVWSLGIVMWELLVGTTPVPFLEEMNYMSCFRAILNWQPRVKELQEYGVSDEGQELLMRMVERTPKFRPNVETLKADECFDYLEYVRKNEPCE